MKHVLQPGDTAEFTQSDGTPMLVLVYQDAVAVKTGEYGKGIKVSRNSSFFIYAKAVDVDKLTWSDVDGT